MVVLTSCSGLTAAERNRPQIRFICSNEEEICRSWAEKYQLETGVRTSYLRLPTSEALARVASHRYAPEFDAWVGGPSENYLVAKDQGLLEPISLPEANIPARYRDRDGHWFGIYASLLGFCVNQDVLDKHNLPVPQSWEDLEDSQWQSWISASSPLTSGTAFTALWTQATIFGPDAARHLKAVYQNVGRLTHSGTAPANVVARGQAAVAISFTPYCLSPDSTAQSSLRIIYPQEGTFYEVGGAAVLAGGNNISQAKSFLSWVTSPTGQTVASDCGVNQIPINESVPGNLTSYLRNTKIRVLDLSTQEASQARAAWLEWFANTQW
ncbi:MAG: ABC transporter substrate-binding protein [Actinomycetaceae bacterium]|nr:ABC transporter substrate-binding protein [Actinomycetaceae bacterium]